jgi:inorganic phosphate transporter, PiT family
LHQLADDAGKNMSLDLILIILVLACGFYAAWNIGANDVANAMGTSVGSGALTLRNAVILAAIFEFAGAVIIGSNVSETIRNGIFDPQALSAVYGERDSYVLALGMIACLFASGTWLMFATYMHWPVSTTHSIVGAVAGFGFVALGPSAVKWKEIYIISGGWLISPVLAAIVSYLCFGFILKTIFYQPNPVAAAKRMAPWLAAMTLFVMVGMTSLKGMKPLWKRLELNTESAWFYVSVCAVALLLGAIAFLVMKHLLRGFDVGTNSGQGMLNPEVSSSLAKTVKHLQRVRNSATGELKEQAEKLLEQAQVIERSTLAQTQDYSASSDLRQVEKIFIGLQIMTACFVAFAHGANDVANAIGPLSAAFQAITEGKIPIESATPLWALILGGAGIVSGLAIWGWKVIRTVGEKITELTPSRGFCAEFSTGLTILLASILPIGLPVSTTHTLVGAVLGIGLAKGINALNLKMLRDILASWVITIPVGAGLSVVIFYFLKLLVVDSGWFDLAKN